MPDSIDVVVDRMVALIEAIPDIGRVYPFDPRRRDDLSPWIHSEIDGVSVMRCWWVSGPTLSTEWVTKFSPQQIYRRWTFTIGGIEGATPAFPGDTRTAGEDIQTVRRFAVAVSDALDAAVDLGLEDPPHAFDSNPCEWREAPKHDWIGSPSQRHLVVRASIEKQIATMPSLT